MKGIVLAGGTGSRLWPVTKAISKQLLPIYDKPMIYYPLSTLMLAGIREILVITTPHEQNLFKELLGDGSLIGLEISYEIQEKPEGLAQTYLIAEHFLSGESSLMILGDNIFHGVGLGHELQHTLPKSGCHIFTYKVSNPKQYGILTLDGTGVPESIIEKPENSDSDLAVTGLYFFDGSVSEVARKVKFSARGELEITSIISEYMNAGKLTFTQISRGAAWLDTGNPKSMNDASNYIRVIEDRTGLKISCPEEIAWRSGWISEEQLLKIATGLGSSEYGKYLLGLLS
jgi:glucose-1-phosphate thymidylyltransferase